MYLLRKIINSTLKTFILAKCLSIYLFENLSIQQLFTGMNSSLIKIRLSSNLCSNLPLIYNFNCYDTYSFVNDYIVIASIKKIHESFF